MTLQELNDILEELSHVGGGEKLNLQVQEYSITWDDQKRVTIHLEEDLPTPDKLLILYGIEQFLLRELPYKAVRLIGMKEVEIRVNLDGGEVFYNQTDKPPEFTPAQG